MELTNECLDNLENNVQLHQSVEINYMVTHYEATLFTDDGNREVAVGIGETILLALIDLDTLVKERHLSLP